jgi:hypothetical protein
MEKSRVLYSLCWHLTFLLLGHSSLAQTGKPVATVENVFIEYEGKTVKAKKLTVRSEIPISIDTAWQNVQTPALLQYVAKGMISFRSKDEPLPASWQLGETYGIKMRVWGFLPFGGTHFLHMDKIDGQRYEIATQEWDNRAKVWNHTITLKEVGQRRIQYEDTIVIYGGALTGFITSFAKRFYKHRQKRWQLVAEEQLLFGS